MPVHTYVLHEGPPPADVKEGDIYYEKRPEDWHIVFFGVNCTFIGLDGCLNHEFISFDALKFAKLTLENADKGPGLYLPTDVDSIKSRGYDKEQIVSQDVIVQGLISAYKLPRTMKDFVNYLQNAPDERLYASGMQALREIFDDELNTPKGPSKGYKLTNEIPVVVEEVQGKILVKVGPPCDLSRFDNDEGRQDEIQSLVEQGLRKSGLKASYEDVYVSANVGVRGLKQRLLMQNGQADHANGYIKCAGESVLTHWEPRDGPQSLLNDTVCAMTITMALAQFEHGVRNEVWKDSKHAGNETLYHPRMINMLHDAQVYRMKEHVGAALAGLFDAMLRVVSFFKDLIHSNKDANKSAAINPHFEQVTNSFKEALHRSREEPENQQHQSQSTAQLEEPDMDSEVDEDGFEVVPR